VNAFVARWFAPSERTTAVAIWTTGNQLGTLLAFPLGTILCPLKHVLLGWPLIFYACSELENEMKILSILGAVGGVWIIVFSIFAKNTPAKSDFISDHEIRFLEQELAEFKFKEKKVLRRRPHTRKPRAARDEQHSMARDGVQRRRLVDDGHELRGDHAPTDARLLPADVL